MLQEGDIEDRCPTKFLRAVASELCLDAPAGVFDSVEGLSRVPAAVPEAARATLLHAAVSSEAANLKPKEAAEAVHSVASSMICRLTERAADLKDKKAQVDALENLAFFAVSTGSLAATLAPDVELGKLTYEGQLRYKTLEGMYEKYIEKNVDSLQQQTMGMMSSMMGGEEKASMSVEQMQAMTEQSEKANSTLASLFKISEGKAEKLMEAKVKQVSEKTQKDLLAGLQNLGGS